MGQGQSAQHTHDTIVGEQFYQYCEFKQTAINKAFQKCVDEVHSTSDAELTPAERQCTEEYATLFSGFVKSGFHQFTQLYEMHQRDMYEKARMEAMQSQARSELKKGK